MYELNQESIGLVNESINVEDYAHLVKRIAHHMIAKMPSFVLVEDLIQSGTIGLLEAAQRYDGSKGASFETYAGIRIRGAIVDEMRRGDWSPRSVHRNTRKITEAISKVEAKEGRDAKDSEIAEVLGVSLKDYHEMSKDSASTRLFSYEDTFDEYEGSTIDEVCSNEARGPAERLHLSALAADLANAIRTLPEREGLVLSLYYEQEMNLKEIGEVLSVSESRVSQIHSQAALRLRSKLSEWSD